MRTTRSSSVAPSTDEDAVSMTQVMDMMRTLQENVAIKVNLTEFAEVRFHYGSLFSVDCTLVRFYRV